MIELNKNRDTIISFELSHDVTLDIEIFIRMSNGNDVVSYMCSFIDDVWSCTVPPGIECDTYAVCGVISKLYYYIFDEGNIEYSFNNEITQLPDIIEVISKVADDNRTTALLSEKFFSSITQLNRELKTKAENRQLQKDMLKLTPKN